MLSTNQDAPSCCSKNDATDLAHKAGHKLREEVDHAADEARGAAAAGVEQMRNKPVQTGLIALGVGFLSGLLLRRR